MNTTTTLLTEGAIAPMSGLKNPHDLLGTLAEMPDRYFDYALRKDGHKYEIPHPLYYEVHRPPECDAMDTQIIELYPSVMKIKPYSLAAILTQIRKHEDILLPTDEGVAHIVVGYEIIVDRLRALCIEKRAKSVKPVSRLLNQWGTIRPYVMALRVTENTIAATAE